MIATCINCQFTDDVKMKVGTIHSDRFIRKANRSPDVFICTECMEAIL